MTESNLSVPCVVCGVPLTIRPARGRKSGKSFLMVICPQDGRHFRGFIADKDYVNHVFEKAEGTVS